MALYQATAAPSLPVRPENKAIPSAPPPFAALDFETSDYGADSACAVGVILVKEGRIADRYSSLIRPPREDILFTAYHGLTWPLLENQPGFAEIWPELSARLAEAEFLVAHNASFDRRILKGCCETFGCAHPDPRFVCTYRWSRRIWPGEPSYRLPDVCRRLHIPQVRHHQADADAEACARLMLAIFEQEPSVFEIR